MYLKNNCHIWEGIDRLMHQCFKDSSSQIKYICLRTYQDILQETRKTSRLLFLNNFLKNVVLVMIKNKNQPEILLVELVPVLAFLDHSHLINGNKRNKFYRRILKAFIRINKDKTNWWIPDFKTYLQFLLLLETTFYLRPETNQLLKNITFHWFRSLK